MKKSLFIGLVAVLGLIGCSRNQEIDIPDANLSLFARTESPADTKTVVESGVHVYWEPGDEIAVFMGEQSAKFTTDITAASGTATFKGTFGDSSWPEDADLWAVYPFSEDAVFDGETITTTLPSTQVAREGSFGKDMNLAIAHSTGTTLQFYNVGGGIRFSVLEEGIKKVMFEGLSGEIISGKVKIGLDDNGKPEVREVTGGSQFITLLPPSGQETFEPGAWYYIVAIPGSLEGGYKLRFYKESDYARKMSEKAVEIKRSIFGSLEKADSEIDFEPQTTHFPETKEEWDASESITLGISKNSKTIVDYYKELLNSNCPDASLVASKLLEIDGISSATPNEDGKSITIVQKDGVYVNLLIELGSFENEHETRSSFSNSPFLSDAKGGDYLLPYPQKALLLSPFQNSHISANGEQKGLWHVEVDRISQDLESIGYEVDSYIDSKANLEKMVGDSLSQYGVIMYVGHGGYRMKSADGSFVSTTISSGQKVGTLSEEFEELYRDKLALLIHDGNAEYAVTVPWLDATTSNDYQSSFVFMGACNTYKDDDLYDYFWRHKARAYIGFNWYSWHNLETDSCNQPNAVLCSVIKGLSYGASIQNTMGLYSTIIKKDYPLLPEVFNALSAIKWTINPYLYLVYPAPTNLKNTEIRDSRTTLLWEQSKNTGEYKFQVHIKWPNSNSYTTYNSTNSKAYTTDALQPGEYSWYVEANLYYDGKVIETFTSETKHFTVTKETPEAIDLGLPSGIKWASFNLGATKPEEYGDYFAWGEMEAKSKYDWSTYIWSNGSYSSLTKYYSDDGKVSLDIEDDAAHKKLGSSWHVPTDSDWRELIKYCNWTPTTRNGIDGMLVTSKTTRATLFLPFAGQKDRTFMEDVGTVGYYWTSSLYPYAPCACVGVTSPEIGEIDRCMGIPIRPVFGDSSSGDSNENQGVVDLGLSVKWGTCNLGASKPEEYGDYYAWGETDFYYLEGHAYDNPCNDWKEGKSSGYGGGSYKWYDYSNNTLTLLKYNLDPSLGIVDGKTVLDPEDDAAHVKLGEKWRIPTDNDWVDLCFYCTLTWTTENGVKGIKMTSKKVGYTGRSIFLPAGGSRYDYELYRIGEKGCYWTSTLDYRSVFASSWDFETLNSMNPSNIPRDLGILIRPVYDDK